MPKKSRNNQKVRSISNKQIMIWEPVLKSKLEYIFCEVSRALTAKFKIGNEAVVLCRVDETRGPNNRVAEIVAYNNVSNHAITTRLLELLQSHESDVEMSDDWDSQSHTYFGDDLGMGTFNDYNGNTLWHLLTQISNCHPDIILC